MCSYPTLAAFFLSVSSTFFYGGCILEIAVQLLLRSMQEMQWPHGMHSNDLTQKKKIFHDGSVLHVNIKQQKANA